MNADTEITLTLTRNECYAAAECLREVYHTRYQVHGGVDLESLADRIVLVVDTAEKNEEEST